MKNTTFRNERIIEQLDTSYYFVSFDGESDEDVTFLGRTFSYKPSGNQTGIHELAEQLGTKNGSVTYPSLIFLNKQFNILYQHDGFLSATALSKILQNLLNTAY